MLETLLFILILLPFIAAGLCYTIPLRGVRSFIILLTGGALILSTVFLIPRIPFRYSGQTIFGIHLHEIVQAADFLLLFIILYFGFKHQSMLIKILSIFQIVLVGYLEFFMVQGKDAAAVIYGDQLSLIMVMIISLVGSLICFQAIPYMINHEKHLQLKISGQNRFFFIMILFLGAMNGLVLANDLLIFYFFFELTTLCSFLLIGHDRTAIAVKNAVRALWMNSLGGAAFISGLVVLYAKTGTLDLQGITQGQPQTVLLIMPFSLLCLAAFTKSAQFPFQSWLLGAMTAPTPVSALLHSSTMVKVGVYLVLRLTPAFRETFLSQCLSICGAFAFLAGAALAVGQRNGKKVLAYSTISNLGLIFVCAGLNSHAAYTAAILLIVFHAVTKALLFMCVGTIEQHIESRDIEDMRGLYSTMPLTALITVIGVIAMIMPPFGLLLGKWMAMEAAADNLFVIIIVALGSALTVMYWARWAGTLMSDPFAGKFKPEIQPFLTWGALFSLCGITCLLSVLSPWIYQWLIAPYLKGRYQGEFTLKCGGLENAYGVFTVIPLCIIAGLGFLISLWAVRSAFRARVGTPYLCGVQVAEPKMFIGPMNRPVKSEARNYYLASIFGEARLTTWINLGALVLLTLMLGGTL